MTDRAPREGTQRQRPERVEQRIPVGEKRETSPLLSTVPVDDPAPRLAEVRDSLVDQVDHDDQQSTITDPPDLPIIWPHEDQRRGRIPSMRGGLRTAARFIRRNRLGQVEGQMDVMARVNGPESAVLADKYTFIDVVRELGYRTPEQTLVSVEEDAEQRIDEARSHFPDGEQKLICKPHNGRGGRGIIELEASDLPGFTSSIDRDYIVQEKVPIQAEFRYARQIDMRDGVIRRIYDEKQIPKVIGDGVKRKWQLIKESNLSTSSKLLTAGLNFFGLLKRVPDGGAMHLSVAGVPKKEVLEWDPVKTQRVENVDRFMRQFITDLQTKLGTHLPNLCFDIGVIDPSVLDAPYDFEKMKANLVPFECQMPYWLIGYADRSSKSLGQKFFIINTMFGVAFSKTKADFLQEPGSK